jgi:hypothetical protein
MDFNNFKVYFTNTLQRVSQIIDEVTSVFIRFGVIWEGPTVEAENMEFISDYTSMDSSSSSSSS